MICTHLRGRKSASARPNWITGGWCGEMDGAEVGPLDGATDGAGEVVGDVVGAAEVVGNAVVTTFKLSSRPLVLLFFQHLHLCFNYFFMQKNIG